VAVVAVVVGEAVVAVGKAVVEVGKAVETNDTDLGFVVVVVLAFQQVAPDNLV